jgi:hypothetical protein
MIDLGQGIDAAQHADPLSVGPRGIQQQPSRRHVVECIRVVARCGGAIVEVAFAPQPLEVVQARAQHRTAARRDLVRQFLGEAAFPAAVRPSTATRTLPLPSSRTRPAMRPSRAARAADGAGVGLGCHVDAEVISRAAGPGTPGSGSAAPSMNRFSGAITATRHAAVIAPPTAHGPASTARSRGLTDGGLSDRHHRSQFYRQQRNLDSGDGQACAGASSRWSTPLRHSQRLSETSATKLTARPA